MEARSVELELRPANEEYELARSMCWQQVAAGSVRAAGKCGRVRSGAGRIGMKIKGVGERDIGNEGVVVVK